MEQRDCPIAREHARRQSRIVQQNHDYTLLHELAAIMATYEWQVKSYLINAWRRMDEMTHTQKSESKNEK